MEEIDCYIGIYERTIYTVENQREVAITSSVITIVVSDGTLADHPFKSTVDFSHSTHSGSLDGRASVGIVPILVIRNVGSAGRTRGITALGGGLIHVEVLCPANCRAS